MVMKKLILFYFVATSMLLTFTLSASALEAEFYLQKPTSSNHVAEVRFRNVNTKDTIFLTLKYKTYDKKIEIFDTLSKSFTIYDTSYYEGGVEEHCIFGEIRFNFEELPYAIRGACFEKYEKEKVLRIIQNLISIFTVEDETIDLRFGVNNSTPNEPFLVTLKFLFEDKTNKISTIKDTSFFVLNEKNVFFKCDYALKERGRFLYELKVSNSFTFDTQNGDYLLNPPLPTFTVDKDKIKVHFHYGSSGNLKLLTDGVVYDYGQVPNLFEISYPTIGDDVELIATDMLKGESSFVVKTAGIDFFMLETYFVYDRYNFNGVKIKEEPTRIIFIERKKKLNKEEYSSKKRLIMKQ